VDLCVEHVMNKNVVTIESDHTAKYAAKMMSYYRISSLVVTSKGRLAGILTERDVVSRVVARGLNAEKVLVNDIMSLPVITTKPTFPLEMAVAVMLKQNIKKLPVLGGRNNEDVVGIVSLTDVAKLHPLIYARMKEQIQMAPESVGEEVDFYVR